IEAMADVSLLKSTPAMAFNNFSLPQRDSIDNVCNPSLAGEQVLSMTIGGNPIDEWESPDTLYHFRIFLVLSGGESVRLDMQPDWRNHQIGTVTITNLESTFTNTPTAIRFDSVVVPGATVAAFINLWMSSLGRDKY
ncbi:hypothetical protein H0H93_001646, partial [Arthromyces matolae]